MYFSVCFWEKKQRYLRLEKCCRWSAEQTKIWKNLMELWKICYWLYQYVVPFFSPYWSYLPPSCTDDVNFVDGFGKETFWVSKIGSNTFYFKSVGKITKQHKLVLYGIIMTSCCFPLFDVRCVYIDEHKSILPVLW